LGKYGVLRNLGKTSENKKVAKIGDLLFSYRRIANPLFLPLFLKYII
jgi:hypothetical protein